MLRVPETAFVSISSVLDVGMKTVLQFVLLLEKPLFTSFLGPVILRHFVLLINSLCVCRPKLFLNKSLYHQHKKLNQRKSELIQNLSFPQV